MRRPREFCCAAPVFWAVSRHDSDEAGSQNLDVKDAKGETTTWTLEATSARGIMANGVKREDVQVGDRIKVRCHLLRDGSPACLLGFVTPDHGDQARGHGVEREWD